MKIVVLAGGLSPERNVSLSSGAMVSEALREQGHQVALVDLFFGTEGVAGPAAALYDAPVPQAFKRIGPQAPDLAQVRAARRDRSPSSIGPGVLELCAGAAVVYLALHGACGEEGRLQAALDLLGVPYTGSGCLASAAGAARGLAVGLTLRPWIICNAWAILYTVGEIQYGFYPATSLLACGAAVGTVTLSALAACFSTQAAGPAELMRPKAPPIGKRILLERIAGLWRRLS